MKLKLLFIFLAFCTLQSQAEVLVYRFLESGRLKGKGYQYSAKMKGELVLDWHQDTGSGTASYAVAFTIQGYKYYFVQNDIIYYPNRVVTYSRPGRADRTETYLDYSLRQFSVEVSNIASGKDAVLYLTPDTTVTFPKSLRGASKGLFADTLQRLLALDVKTTAVYQKTPTLSANAEGLTSQQYIARLDQSFEEQGYEKLSTLDDMGELFLPR